MDRDLGWVILFFIVLFVMWYVSGGTFNSGIIMEPLKQGLRESQQPSEPTPSVIEETPSAKKPEDSGASPHKGKVHIRTGNVTATDPDKEYFRLYADYLDNERINITGWILVNENNEEQTIGKGAEIAYSAQINPEYNIMLDPGGEALILTGKSPINTNFKINICTGYFTQFQTFEPTISKSCPAPSKSPGLYETKDDSCIDYVNSLPICVMPLEIPFGLQNACQDFISSHINYNGCVKDYKDSKSFFKKEWRVYLGRSEEFWPRKYSTITVLDQSRRLVDSLDY